MVRIAVTGHAEASLPAERATVRVDIRAEDGDRASAMAAVTETHASLSAKADQLVAAGAATRWSASRIRISREREWREEGGVRESRLVHHVAADLTVRFRDFAALADWLAELGEQDGIDVQDVAWSLTDEVRTEVEREVRVEAVRDALARAQDYASALGLDTVELDALWEPGLRPAGGSAGSGSDAQALGRTGRATRGASRITLQSEEISVTAVVTADFTAR